MREVDAPHLGIGIHLGVRIALQNGVVGIARSPVLTDIDTEGFEFLLLTVGTPLQISWGLEPFSSGTRMGTDSMCGSNTLAGAMPTMAAQISGGGVSQYTPDMSIGQSGIGQQGVDQHGGGHHEMIQPKNPQPNDPRFLAGSVGPMVKKDDAPKIEIPDGKGFGDLKGRKQNDGDKAQNRYSTTDANFYPTLGLLPKDPDTGQQMNYVQHIQSYNAAGYIAAFAPEAYAELVAQQDAGNGTVLGGALYLMGVVKTADPSAARIPQGSVPMQIPGTPLSARDVVMSPKDATGQDWARPHHAESSWSMFKQLMEVPGMDYRKALVLSGDDAVSGAGRLNGFNNQDGNTGLNADERAVYKLGASMGSQVFGIMMGGHNHTGLDESAKTNPKINKLISKELGIQVSQDDRSSSPQRLNAVHQLFMQGSVGGDAKTGEKADKFQIKDKTGAFKLAEQAGGTGAAATGQYGGSAQYQAGLGSNTLAGKMGTSTGTPDLTQLVAQLRDIMQQMSQHSFV